MADTAAAAAAPAATTTTAPAAAPSPEVTPTPGKPTKVFYTRGNEPAPAAPSTSSRQDRLTAIKEAAATLNAPPSEAPLAPPEQAKEAPKSEAPSKADEKRAEFAAVARAEKRVREQAKAHQEAVTKFEAERAAFQARTAKADALERLANSDDPYAALDELARMTGKKFDVNDWARRQIRQGQPQTNDEALARVEKLEKAAAEKEASAKVEAERANYANVRSQVIAEVDALVQNDTEKYALIGAKKQSAAVFELISENFRQTGKLLTYEQACDAVEAHLEEDAASYLGVDKVKKKFGAPPASVSQETPSSDQRSAKTPTSERKPNSTTTPDRVPSSRKERLAAAVAILSAPPPKR